MQQLKITPEGVKALQARLNKFVFIPFAIGIIVFAIIQARDFASMINSPWMLTFELVLLACVFGGLFYINYRRLRKSLENMTFLYDGSSLTRTSMGASKEVTIHFLELSNVKKSKRGDLVLYGATRNDILYVSKYLEHFDEVSAQLEVYMPQASRTPVSKVRQVVAFVPLIAMLSGLVVILNDESHVIMAAAICFLFSGSYSIYLFFTNKNVKSNQKLYYLLIMGVLLINIISKLFLRSNVMEYFHF